MSVSRCHSKQQQRGKYHDLVTSAERAGYNTTLITLKMGSCGVPHLPGFTQLAHKLAMSLEKSFQNSYTRPGKQPSLVRTKSCVPGTELILKYCSQSCMSFVLFFLFVCFCAKFVVYSCYLVLCGVPIELCSIVVIYLDDFDIGLCHPLIVQCIHVRIMKVFMMRERTNSGKLHYFIGFVSLQLN